MGGAMNRLVFIKTVLMNKYFLGLLASCLLAFSFQNCSKVGFTQVETLASIAQTEAVAAPFCSPASRPRDFENMACPSPNLTSLLAIQNYNVICQDDGTWSRQVNGSPNYSFCSSVCSPSMRPADKENVACPAPYQSEMKGVVSYNVICAANGSWSREIKGAADYSACSQTCDITKMPPRTVTTACQVPFSNIQSGIQNFAVTCLSNGTWKSAPNGSIDYRNCPQSCDQTKKPTARDLVKCPTSNSVLAYQNYDIKCEYNGTWSRAPGSLDTAACPTPTCDPATKPPTSQITFCSAPFQSSRTAVQNYSVTCTGTTWFWSPTTLDETSCPKNCAPTKPANTQDLLSCQSPFEGQKLAIQQIIYSCNNSTGLYERNTSGPIDYSGCPKSCAGTRPSDRQSISCPVGFTGTAYRYLNISCDTSTGTYVTTPTTTVDYNGCSPIACSAMKPPSSVAQSCPAPFADRNDARQLYSVNCVAGSWVSEPIGGVDTSSCPVNDCTGSPNPGTEKIIRSCGGGASGNVKQSCQLLCTGRTYTQVNCTADNYSECDCGANSTYDTGTKQCVPNPIKCVPSHSTNSPVPCDSGYNGGTKFTTTSINCPNGSYGAPVVSTSGYNTGSCVACPGPETRTSTPTCAYPKSPVPGSKVNQIAYSCDSGSAAVATDTVINAGSCKTCQISYSPRTYNLGFCSEGSEGNYVPPPSCTGYADNGKSSYSRVCDPHNQEFFAYTVTCVCQ